MFIIYTTTLHLFCMAFVCRLTACFVEIALFGLFVAQSYIILELFCLFGVPFATEQLTHI